eukprot:gene20950-15457_t
MRVNITRWYERRWQEMHNLTLGAARRQHQHHFGHTRYLHKLHHHHHSAAVAGSPRTGAVNVVGATQAAPPPPPPPLRRGGGSRY